MIYFKLKVKNLVKKDSLPVLRPNGFSRKNVFIKARQYKFCRQVVLIVLSTFADISGITSLILTIALLIKSEAMRKEIESQRADYIKEQKAIKERLAGLRANIVDDNLLNMKVISDLRTQLFSYNHKFKRLLTREDRKHLKVTLALLDNDVSNIGQKVLCAELDYFVARFERKERK